MLTSTIQAIIFDFGGVLINWDPHMLFNKYFDNNASAIDDFLSEIDFNAWNLSQDKGYPFAKAVVEHSAKFPQYAHLIRAYDEEWEQSITGTIPGTEEILVKLKALGYKLYGLTNWSAEKFSLVRHKYTVFDLFEDIVVSGEVKLIKPDPAIFKVLLHRIQHKPEECLLVDDSEFNLKAAQKMGFSICSFSSPAQLKSDLQRLGLLPND
jgi:2-haloacid dehalogenase